MIDWHSHILPGMDDGSKDIDESSMLLRMSCEQDVETVIATPHFYANDESVSDFIERRRISYENLRNSLSVESPSIMLGAEVRYYSGIGKLSELNRLCIEKNELLLLEMPMAAWTEYTVKELIDIVNTRNVKLILAHVERYFPFQSSGVWNKLYEAGILMQVNASYFTEMLSKRKALSHLQNGNIHLIGSDCHNIKHRPQKLGKAYEIIRKKFGDDFVTRFNEYGHSLLNEN